MIEIEYKLDCLIGKKIKRVELDGHRNCITFFMDNGKAYAFNVEGDCCSHSWIEHLETPHNVEGATVLSWDDQTMDSFDDGDYDHIRVYENRVRTDKGDVVMEYRNSSNGYYGGYIEFAGAYDYE